jgi:hypothetical protein
MMIELGDSVMLSNNNQQLTEPEMYSIVKELLEDYYSLEKPSISPIELMLEKYHLTGKQVLELIDDVIKSHPEYVRLSKKLWNIESPVSEMEEIFEKINVIYNNEDALSRIEEILRGIKDNIK